MSSCSATTNQPTWSSYSHEPSGRKISPVLALLLGIAFGLATFGVEMLGNQADLSQNRNADLRPSISEALRSPNPAALPIGPSSFKKESAMRPAELLARWNPDIKSAARQLNIPEEWIRAVMRMESGGRTLLGENKPIISSAGAVGIMQVMPETYAEMRAQYKLGADPQNPKDNILAGAAYLRWLHHKYGFAGMFAAYNAGPGTLEKHLQKGSALPPETQAYVQRIGNILGKTSELVPATPQLATLTRPDGSPVAVAGVGVTSIRAPFPGEYPHTVQSVIDLGNARQGVREDVQTATNIVRNHGGKV